MEKEQNVHIDGLKFDRVTGSTLNPLNAFILTSMKPNSNFIVKNFQVINTALNVVKPISIGNSLTLFEI